MCEQNSFGWSGFLIGIVLGFTPIMGEIDDIVHPDWELIEIPLDSQYNAMGMHFLSNGDLVIANTEYVGTGEVPVAQGNDGRLDIISGITGDNINVNNIEVRTVANNWLQIAGIVIVQDKIYVSDRDAFYSINDNNASTAFST